uniref:Uncharacterized protein n=1 Tax=Rhizophora mucronata TaxID=61149 RepID=A0A2P2IY91_RHIMU
MLCHEKPKLNVSLRIYHCQMRGNRIFLTFKIL